MIALFDFFGKIFEDILLWDTQLDLKPNNGTNNKLSNPYDTHPSIKASTNS